MDIKSIKDRLKNFKPKPMDYEVSFAVLVPLIEIDGELNIIYEVRSNSITQPGEISFPGGRIEEGESPQEAAIRETSEELLLNKANIEIIRELNYASSKSGAFVFTFLGLIKDLDPYEIGYNTDEVSEVFFVFFLYFKTDVFSVIHDSHIFKGMAAKLRKGGSNLGSFAFLPHYQFAFSDIQFSFFHIILEI
jgi:coenzyme A diphosphatase NUDT7